MKQKSVVVVAAAIGFCLPAMFAVMALVQPKQAQLCFPYIQPLLILVLARMTWQIVLLIVLMHSLAAVAALLPADFAFFLRLNQQQRQQAPLIEPAPTMVALTEQLELEPACFVGFPQQLPVVFVAAAVSPPVDR